MKSRDEMILIKLMGKTGVCINKMSKPILEYLVSKIVDMISKRDFLNVLVPWIEEIAQGLLDDQHLLNHNIIANFVESIKRLAEDYGNGVSPQVRQSAQKLVEPLSQALKFF